MKYCYVVLFLLAGMYCLAQDPYPKGQLKWVNKQKKLIAKGDMAAAYGLGYWLSHLQNENELNKEGQAIIIACAASGYGPCIRERGHYFFYASSNYDPAYTLLRDSSEYYFTKAAGTGDSLAMFLLAHLYQNGRTVNERLYDSEHLRPTPELFKAKFWYEQALANGYAASKDYLDKINMAINDPFVNAAAAYRSKNYKTALDLWKVDADINFNPVAALNVGYLYLNGANGVEKSSDRARWSFEQAGNLGNGEGSYNAAGIWWAGGSGTPAMEWYEKAVKQGYKPAEGALADVQGQLSRIIAQRNAQSAEQNLRMSVRENVNNSYSSPSVAPAKKTWCNDCHGSGKLARIEYYADKRNGLQSGRTVYDNCGRCYGKGYY